MFTSVPHVYGHASCLRAYSDAMLSSTVLLVSKLQALVYGILPSTAAVFSYVIDS